jgi:hypothetical protein
VPETPNDAKALALRALWDRLNVKQAKLWLAAGKKVTPEQQKIIDQMDPIAPPGYEGW